MSTKKTTEKDNHLATKDDVQQSIDQLRSDLITEIEGTEKHLTTKIDKLDTKISNLDTKVGKLDIKVSSLDIKVGNLEQGQAAILQVVKSIDEKLKESKGIPERVERLENTVYLPH